MEDSHVEDMEHYSEGICFLDGPEGVGVAVVVCVAG